MAFVVFSDVTLSQNSTPVYTLNPELMCRSIITDVQMYRFAKVTIDLEFALKEKFITFSSSLLIIKLIVKLDNRPFETFTMQH